LVEWIAEQLLAQDAVIDDRIALVVHLVGVGMTEQVLREGADWCDGSDDFVLSGQ
jgi:hypothetical protein